MWCRSTGRAPIPRRPSVIVLSSRARSEAGKAEPAQPSAKTAPDAPVKGDAAPAAGAPAKKRSPRPLPAAHRRCCCCSASAAGTAISGGRPAASWSRPTTPISRPMSRLSASRSRAMSPSVDVKDGDAVKAGDVLVKLDDTDYRLALDVGGGQARHAGRDDRAGSPARSTAQQAADRQRQGRHRLGRGRADAQRRAPSSGPSRLPSRTSRARPCSTRPSPTATAPSPPSTPPRRRWRPPRPISTSSRRRRRRPSRSAKELDTAVDKARERPRVHRDPRARRRRRRQPRRPARPVCRARLAPDGARADGRASISPRTSRRRSSPSFEPGQTVDVSVDSMAGHSFTAQGRQPVAGLGLDLQPAAARERDRQFHQDHPAPAGPRSRCRPTSPPRAFCAPACRSSSPSTSART